MPTSENIVRRLAWRSVLVLIGLGAWFVAQPLSAGSLKHPFWAATTVNRQPQSFVTPQSRTYVVVDPATHPWQRQNLSTHSYPWGWFGARKYPHETKHTRYHGTSRDRTVWWGH